MCKTSLALLGLFVSLSVTQTALGASTPQFQFTQATEKSLEPLGFIDLTVERVGASDTVETVTFSAVAGTAQDDDFSPVDSVTFDAGVTSKTVRVFVTPDEEPDNGETFTVTIDPAFANPAPGAITAATISILNNDLFADAAVIAGSSGNIVGSAADSSAEDGEPPSNGQVTSNAGTVWFQWTAPATGPFSFYTPHEENAFNDIIESHQFAIYTGDTVESLTRVITAVPDIFTTSGAYRANFYAHQGTVYHLAVVDSFTSNVFDLHWAPGSLFAFSSATYTTAESAGVVTLTVNRSGDLSAAAFVEMTTASGTAIANTDFVTTAKNLVFEALQTSATVSIPLVNDTVHELDETFTASLEPSLISGSIIGNGVVDPILGTTTITITSDDPFTVRAGNFQGVISLGEDFAHNGTVNVTVAADGKLTGKLVYGGKTYPFKATLGADGSSSVNIARKPPLGTLTLHLASTGGGQRFVFSLTDGVQTISANADRQSYDAKINLAPHFGTYTVYLDSGALPQGNGFATASVATNGALKLIGTLGDGTPFTASGLLTVSPDTDFGAAHVSLYVPLYKNGGYLRGDLVFAPDSPTDDITADLAWLKPSLPKEKFYPDGFAVTAALHGQRYTAPSPGVRALPGLDSVGYLLLAVDGAGIPDTHAQCYWLVDNQINTGAFLNPLLALKVNAKSGLILGSVTAPGSKPYALKAVILQQTSAVQGQFLNPATKTSGIFQRE